MPLAFYATTQENRAVLGFSFGWGWWQRLVAFGTSGRLPRLGRLRSPSISRQINYSLRDAFRLSSGAINSLSAHICVLDADGVILTCNRAWMTFAKANGANLSAVRRGADYLKVCDGAQGPEREQARAFAEGIRAIIRGEKPEFATEYTCDSPSEPRWFVARVTRFRVRDKLRVVVAHEEITPLKMAMLALRKTREELEQRVQERTADLQRANLLLRASHERFIGMSVRLLNIQESERRNVARELHDEIGQLLTTLKILLEMSVTQAPEQAQHTALEAKTIAGDLLERVRQISLNLRPPMLDDLGLRPTLDWSFKRFTSLTGITVQFSHTGLEERLPPTIETAAYRLIQEALTNVARHAHVRAVEVGCWRGKESLSLLVEDGGAGFDAEAVLGAGISNGLSGMRERIDLLSGDFEVQSTPGSGTRVLMKIPIEPDEQPGTLSESARAR